MPKKTSRPFANLLRSWGWRGGQEEQGFGLAPVVTPVAIAANEPDTLPRYMAGGSIAVGGAPFNAGELVSSVPIRVRLITGGGGTATGCFVWPSASDLLTANIVALPVTCTHGHPTRSTARQGTMAALPSATGGLYITGSTAARPWMGYLDDPFILPAGMRCYVIADTAGFKITFGFAWEELGA